MIELDAAIAKADVETLTWVLVTCEACIRLRLLIPLVTDSEEWHHAEWYNRAMKTAVDDGATLVSLPASDYLTHIRRPVDFQSLSLVP